MSIYLFSVMASPQHALKSIRNLQRNFLWGECFAKQEMAFGGVEITLQIQEKRRIGSQRPPHSQSSPFCKNLVEIPLRFYFTLGRYSDGEVCERGEEGKFNQNRESGRRINHMEIFEGAKITYSHSQLLGD